MKASELVVGYRVHVEVFNEPEERVIFDGQVAEIKGHLVQVCPDEWTGALSRLRLGSVDLPGCVGVDETWVKEVI